MEYVTSVLATAIAESNSTLPSWTGFLFLFGSSSLYGSNYLPVKAYDTGDGQFFQLLVCIGIWLVGFVLNIIRDFPKFYMLPMLGGALWATGNNTVVPIIQTIGIGLGMIFWNSISLVTGWATARFGLFGLNKEIPSNLTLNYIGVALVLLSTVFYLMVKKAEEPSRAGYDEIAATAADDDAESKPINSSEQLTQKADGDASLFGRLSMTNKRIVGISLSVGSGLLYGQAFTPIVYVRDNYAGASQNSMDHLFSFYTGIMVTSFVFFILYCIVKKNKPTLYNELVLPGLASGVMWGLANICYFNANNVLPQSVIFPIAASGPAIVGSLWSVLWYKEITGVKNLVFLCLGFTVALTGVTLSGLSK